MLLARLSAPITNFTQSIRFLAGRRPVPQLQSAMSLVSVWRKRHTERSALFNAAAEVRSELIERGLDVEGELKKPFWKQ